MGSSADQDLYDSTERVVDGIADGRILVRESFVRFLA